MPALADEILRLAVMLAVLFFVARPALAISTYAVGRSSAGGGGDLCAVDRAGSVVSVTTGHFFLFDNSVMGSGAELAAEAARHDVPVLLLRTLRAVAIVPIIEELFWRGWLMRWVIDNDFRAGAAGHLFGAVVLDGGAAVRERTWAILGRGPGGGDHFQLVDDSHQEPGRFDFGACGGERLSERLRDRGGEMGILALSCGCRSRFLEAMILK